MSYNEIKQHGTEDFPIELYRIDRTHSRYEMEAHWHSEFEIIRVLKGTLKVRLNNSSYTLGAGEIIFVNSETLHQASPIDCEYECIVFRLGLLSSKYIESSIFIDCIRNHECMIDEFHAADSKLAAAVNNLFDIMSSPTESSGDKFRILGALFNLFGEIIAQNCFKPTESVSLTTEKNISKLKNVLSYMRSHYDSPLTLDEMAYAAGMSSKYFCHFFKELTTKTPIEYLTLYRIEKATRKLVTTDMSVTDIALSCGFNDLSYFIKTFKSIKSTTPAQYRKSAL